MSEVELIRLFQAHPLTICSYFLIFERGILLMQLHTHFAKILSSIFLFSTRTCVTQECCKLNNLDL